MKVLTCIKGMKLKTPEISIDKRCRLMASSFLPDTKGGPDVVPQLLSALGPSSFVRYICITKE